LHESISSLAGSVKLIENEEKIEKKKPSKQVKNTDEEDENYKIANANLAAEMAIIGDFGNSKKRKMNFHSETQIETQTGPKIIVKKKPTIDLVDWQLYKEKEK
jgi:hypothetical protein